MRASGDIVLFMQQIGSIKDSVTGGNPNLKEQLLTSAIGPAGGVGNQVITGYQKFAAGNHLEGIASFMPRSIYHLFNGWNESQKGIMVGGKQITPPLNGAQLMGEFLGLPVTSTQEAKDAAYAGRQAASNFSQTRNQLITRAVTARENGESMPADVQEFNDRNPASRITMGDVIKKQNAAKQVARSIGGAKGAALKALQARQARFATEE